MTSPEPAFDAIRKAIYDVLPQWIGKAIDPAASLEHMGANSVERADIVLMTLEQLRLDIPLVEVFGPRNVGELARLLDSKLHAA